MIDDVLRADAQRWNAGQPPVPDLDEAINRLDRGARAPRSRRMMLSGLAAASVVAAAAAVVVISASVGQGGHGTSTTAATRPVATATKTVLHELSVTRTATITETVFATETNHGNSVPVTVTVRAATTTIANRIVSRQSVDIATITAMSTVHVDLASTKAHPVVGHTRALLASIGLFVAIAGAWGIGRAQRRRAH